MAGRPRAADRELDAGSVRVHHPRGVGAAAARAAGGVDGAQLDGGVLERAAERQHCAAAAVRLAVPEDGWSRRRRSEHQRSQWQHAEPRKRREGKYKDMPDEHKLIAETNEQICS